MNVEAIVIGTSAGGLKALQKILDPLPEDFRFPILIVQHRWPTQNDLMVFTLNESCQLQVKEAKQFDPICAGNVYLAPANYHLLVEPDSFLIDHLGWRLHLKLRITSLSGVLPVIFPRKISSNRGVCCFPAVTI